MLNMARMPMPRDRAAPMDWERETSFTFPNVLDSSESTGFDASGQQADSQMHESSSFGRRPANKGVDSSTPPKRPFTDVWGSAIPRPLRQDSLQGSSGPNPPQPPALGGPLFFGTNKRASSFTSPSTDTSDAPAGKHSTLKRSDTLGVQPSPLAKDTQARFSFFSSATKDSSPRGHSDETKKKDEAHATTTTPSSFERLLSLSGPWGASKSSAMAEEVLRGTHELSIGGRSRPLATGAIKRVLRNRNAMGESEYWNVHADDAMYHQPRSDSENEEHHGSANSGIKPKTASPSSTTLTAPNRRNTANRTGTRTHRPKPTLQQTRSWQENVDLPFILSAYAQLLLNMILVACLFAIGYNAYATIQEEVSTELSKAELQRGKKYDECRRAYDTTCRGETLLEGTMMYCKGLQQCIEENTHIVGKAVLSARTYATIANAFVHTLTWKTMMFLLLLVLGGLFVSNYALNSYRTNYVLHHQHHIATNSTSKPHDRKKSSNSPFLPRLPADSNEFNNNANADARTPEYIDDDRARRRLLPAASRFDPPENGGDSSESDVDMASTRRVMALPSS